MWQWCMDTGHEDWRQQGMVFTDQLLYSELSAIRVQALARDIALCSWSHSASLHPDIWMDTRKRNVGSNPAMDYHSNQEGEEIE